MPDAKDNAKLTGDTHPPEVEEATPGLPDDAPRGADADGTERARGMARDLADEGRPGKGRPNKSHKCCDRGAGPHAVVPPSRVIGVLFFGSGGPAYCMR